MSNIVYPGEVPPAADLCKDLRMQQPFRLNDLLVSGQLVSYHIEPARNVTCPQANLSEVAPGQKSPKKSTEGT